MAARPRSLDELRGESLHPPVHADVVNGDAALGQQFLDVAVGQPAPQVPADGDRDHLRREPEASEDRSRATCSHRTSLLPSAIDQRNSADYDLFYNTIPITADKTVATVTLPVRQRHPHLRHRHQSLIGSAAVSTR
jgi:hypothetical protein